MSGTIRTARGGRLAVITLANPVQRNALSPNGLHEPTTALLAEADSDAGGRPGGHRCVSREAQP
jgi:hypothetical protein